jgi:hypothetical protein
MATPGKSVMTDSGKRGVRAGGKAAVFNAAGKCPECCPACPFCKYAGEIEYQMVLSGLVFLCKVVATTGYKAVDGGELNGTHALPWDSFEEGLTRCHWLYDVNVTVNQYADHMACTGDITTLQQLIRVHLLYDDSIKEWELIMDDSNGDFVVFHCAGVVGDCEDTLVFTNDNSGSWGAGGTATITIP